MSIELGTLPNKTTRKISLPNARGPRLVVDEWISIELQLLGNHLIAVALVLRHGKFAVPLEQRFQKPRLDDGPAK